MNKLFRLARGLNERYPEGNEPYQMVTRLAEECGEVASCVNHLEGSGIKRMKYGEPYKTQIASEIKNVLSCAMQLALYYEVEAELAASIDSSLKRLGMEE